MTDATALALVKALATVEQQAQAIADLAARIADDQTAVKHKTEEWMRRIADLTRERDEAEEQAETWEAEYRVERKRAEKAERRNAELARRVHELTNALKACRRMFSLDLCKHLIWGADYNQALVDVSKKVETALTGAHDALATQEPPTS